MSEGCIKARDQQVKSNGGVSGIDEEEIRDIVVKGQVEDLIPQAQEGLVNRTYRPQPVRRVEIPKSQGGKRPLGIATVRDRVVQTAIKIVLEPVFEADFHDCSYEYRPKRDAKMASIRLRSDLYNRAWGVLEIDLKSYFDSIPQNKLMKLVALRVSDGAMLELVKRCIQVGVSHDGVITPTRIGAHKDHRFRRS
jgi:RNA-directed DNA polymerase